MSAALAAAAFSVSAASIHVHKLHFSPRPAPILLFPVRRSFPTVRASTDTDLSTELDAVSSFSEIVPDTVVFDDICVHTSHFVHSLPLINTAEILEVQMITISSSVSRFCRSARWLFDELSHYWFLGGPMVYIKAQVCKHCINTHYAHYDCPSMENQQPICLHSSYLKRH